MNSEENVVVRYPTPPPPRWWFHALVLAWNVALAFASGYVYCAKHVAQLRLDEAVAAQQEAFGELAAAREARQEANAYRDRAKALAERWAQKQGGQPPRRQSSELIRAAEVSSL